MSAGAPWSVKGIDPKAREIAKDLARRSGMTLGEWLNQMILEGEPEEEDAVVPMPRRAPYVGRDRRAMVRRFEDAYADEGPRSDRPSLDRVGFDRTPFDRTPFERALDERALATERDRVNALIEALAVRIEAAESRSSQAITGVDRAVAGLLSRLETGEREQSALAARLDAAAARSDAAKEEARAEQDRLADRLREVERDLTGPRSMEAIKALETALGKLANQLYEGEARTRVSLEELRQDMTAATRRIDRAESLAADPAALAQTVAAQVATQMAQRLEQAEARTSGAIRALESTFVTLDERLRGAEQRLGADRESRFERLAEDLGRRVEDSRAELLRRLDQASDARITDAERAVSELMGHVEAAERRSAEALERMSQEILDMAGSVDQRVAKVEQAASAQTQKMGGEISRLAHAVESRLRRSDDRHGRAIEKLGVEVARISEQLAERIGQAERRTALTADDVSDRLTRATDKLQGRYERAMGDLSERIRQSEERTARLLEEARERIEQSLTRAEERAAALVESQKPAPSAPPAFAPAPIPPQALRSDPLPAALFETEVEVAGPLAGGTPAADPLFDAGVPGPRSRREPEPFSASDIFDDLLGDSVSAPRGVPAASDRAPVHASTRVEEVAWAPSGGWSGDEDPIQTPLAGDADPAGLEGFSADTEFVAPEKPAVSTREAIQAARAAARLGVRNGAAEGAGASPLFPGLKRDGKGRLQERVEKEGRRDSSTVKKALLSSAVAVTLVSSLTGYWLLFVDRDAPPSETAISGEPSADPVQAPLAALAVAPPETDPTANREAETLYQGAVAKLADGKAGALDDLLKAANLGYAPAQFHLGQLYASGESGVRKDPAAARRWTERAAEGGDRRAMHNLAMFLFEGSGGPADPAAAASWFRKAAELGFVDSQFNLGRTLEKGLGVAKDPAEAYRWYRIAARSGDQEARAAAEALAPQLSAAERERGERIAATFRAPDEPSPSVAAAR